MYLIATSMSFALSKVPLAVLWSLENPLVCSSMFGECQWKRRKTGLCLFDAVLAPAACRPEQTLSPGCAGAAELL